MKDKKIVQTDYNDVEVLLRTKMNELSDSVDCFDRISERVFAENLSEFGDCGDVVTELENVTGKPRISRIIKGIAFTAAAAAVIAVVPQTDIGREMLSNIAGETDSDDFAFLVNEIEAELKDGEYRVTDVSLDYYIKNDVLVTPLFCCPFEECERDNTYVRIFTKQLGGYDTSQIYAVLYSDTYTPDNFIAAAKSRYKFTAEDMTAELGDGYEFYNSAESVIEKLYYMDEKMGYLYDETGGQYSAGAFDNTMITKNEQGETVKVSSEIVIINNNTGKYQYDIIFNENGIDNYSREKMWVRSLYFNGNSSFPVILNSDFEETDLLQKIPENQAEKSDLIFTYPFEESEMNIDEFGNPLDSLGDVFTVSTNALSSYLIAMPVPKNPEALMTLRMYIPTIWLDNGDSVYLDNTVYQNSLDMVNDIPISREEQEAEYEKKMAEIENFLELERLRLEEEIKLREAQKAEEIRKEAVKNMEEIEQRAMEEQKQRAMEEQKKLGEVTKPIGN